MPPDPIELLFLGTGTSSGVPMIGCHCPVCSSSDPRDKRTRPSVVISYGGQRVLVDTSPELRLQAIANGVDRVDAIVYTHGHADHIMGLDDVRRFNAARAGPLEVWADETTFEVLHRCFGYAFREPTPDLKLFRPHLHRHPIAEPFEVAGRTWQPIPLFHGEQPILGFRIGSLAYLTDVSRIPEASFELLQGVDLLVLDALQHHKHPTHFTLAEAVAAAGRVARQTYFTHIAHGLSHAQTNATLPSNLQLAFDGLRVQTLT